MLAKAIELAARVFVNKKDKQGKPYILHCLHVMNNVDQNDEELMQIAVLHDVIEDTANDESPITALALLEMGFSRRVVAGVKCLTHTDDESYEDYIKRIAMNEDARLVKLQDLRHNSDITRIKNLRKKDFDRIEKYHRSYIYLS